jgi:hypothetical protein
VVTGTVVGAAATTATVVSAIATIAAVVIAVHPCRCVAIAAIAAVAAVAAVVVTPVVTGGVIADVMHRRWIIAAVTGQRRGGGRAGGTDRRCGQGREHAG